MSTADHALISVAEAARLAVRLWMNSLPNPRPESVSWPSSASTIAVLRTLKDYLGEPTLYGGTPLGPSIRWRNPDRTLLLQYADGSFRLTVHETDQLERAGSHGEQGVIWLLHRGDATPPPMPTAGAAADWESLEESLRVVLVTLGHQVPDQLGPDEWVAFDLVNHSDGDRTMLFMVTSDEGLSVWVSAHDSEPVHDFSRDRSDGPLMLGRGWHEYVPQLQYWRADYELGATGAADAARLAVADLRARGTSTNRVSAARITCSDRGTLALPGLRVASTTA